MQIESVDLKKTQLREINMWWNSVYRVIFGYNKWESVRELMFYLGKLNLTAIYDMRKVLFYKKCINEALKMIIFQKLCHIL